MEYQLAEAQTKGGTLWAKSRSENSAKLQKLVPKLASSQRDIDLQYDSGSKEDMWSKMPV
uniref:Uncharacterized protein n=1 Tax=Romanomermis culicivorax TaxID=13658 RepID=A0A915K9M5_ROMCU